MFIISRIKFLPNILLRLISIILLGDSTIPIRLVHNAGIAVNLAATLANKCQLKVGLLDADVYGPNVPIMMKLNRKPEVTEGIFFSLLN